MNHHDRLRQRYPIPVWATASQPQARAEIKATPEDFQVEEILGFEPEGEGEHVFMFIEKRGINTRDLLNTIARQLAIQPKHISYSGLKDRHAVTRQWLSIWTPNALKPEHIQSQDFRVLKTVRHRSKLKRGTHRANRFKIVLGNLQNIATLEDLIARVQQHGVPNYFGSQRFGRHGKNVDKAAALFAGQIRADRLQRGIYLSAARSYLFNMVLSERVQQGSWSQGLPGEVMMLAGSQSFFCAHDTDDMLLQRLADFDIHPSAPLWGKGALKSLDAALELESSIMQVYPELTAGLEDYGLRQQRRATRLQVEDLSFDWLDRHRLQLSFTLGRGSFATVVLRELVLAASV